MWKSEAATLPHLRTPPCGCRNIPLLVLQYPQMQTNHCLSLCSLVHVSWCVTSLPYSEHWAAVAEYLPPPQLVRHKLSLQRALSTSGRISSSTSVGASQAFLTESTEHQWQNMFLHVSWCVTSVPYTVHWAPGAEYLPSKVSERDKNYLFSDPEVSLSFINPVIIYCARFYAP
jgi:hypothetical protein